MTKQSTKPPDLFTREGLRDPVLRDQQWASSSMPVCFTNDRPLLTADRNTIATPHIARTRPKASPHTGLSYAQIVSHTPAKLNNDPHHQQNRLPQKNRGQSTPEIDTSTLSDSDTEMASAQSSFEGAGEGEDSSEPDIFERVPNLFRLLDLIDEHGSGGIVEKIVIDQNSLHRLLNTLQPGSYDSVSKINFKSLDNLSIKAIGLYGIRSEIVKYLRQARCLDDNTTELLFDQLASTGSSASTLRSGLYFILELGSEETVSLCKQAYIVYWPEESTWDDQAASSSVRRNRVTFMRYLSKLAEQTVALVSPKQANNFVWDTGARNKDLPADQANEDDDESRLFSFEVSKSLEQEEDAIPHPGFSVAIESKHLAKNAGMDNVQFVPGEQKVGLLVSIDEPSRIATTRRRDRT